METRELRRKMHRRAAARPADRPFQIARMLGWFSIGLGVMEIVMPGRLARLIGIRERTNTKAVMRAMGVREVGHGAAILLDPHSSARLWSRVAGDALDVALLGRAMASSRNDRGRLSAALAAVLGVAAVDVYDSLHLNGQGRS